MLRITEKIARHALMVGGAMALLLGCPLYEDDCDSRNDCARGFRCDLFSQRCEPILDEPGCRRPDQCAAGETCAPDFVCRPGSCQFHGCVSGYRCDVVDSAHACVLANAAGGADAAVPPDAGNPDASPPAGAGGAGDAGIVDAGDASL